MQNRIEEAGSGHVQVPGPAAPVGRMNITVTKEFCGGLGGAHEVHVIRRDGAIVIGGGSAEKAMKHLDALNANDWRYLDCYDCGHPEPLAWIAYVRDRGWTFENHSTVDVGADGRVFFHGNLQEYSAAFRYLILDPALADEIRRAAPEVHVKEGL